MHGIGYRKQFRDRPPGDRIDERGANLGERRQDEAALPEPRMRQHQSGLVHDDIGEQNEIEIERSWCVRVGTLAAAVPLDREETLEHSARRQAGDADRGGIEEGRSIRSHVDGRGFDVGRNTKGGEKFREPRTA